MPMPRRRRVDRYDSQTIWTKGEATYELVRGPSFWSVRSRGRCGIA